MTAQAAFKPSQVVLLSGPPLTDTMGRVEWEVAAGLLVRVCHANGDAWQAVTKEMLKATLDKDIAESRSPVAFWVRNPFLRPDMDGLVENGFARWGADGDGPIEFTEAGLKALEKWVQR